MLDGNINNLIQTVSADLKLKSWENGRVNLELYSKILDNVTLGQYISFHCLSLSSKRPIYEAYGHNFDSVIVRCSVIHHHLYQLDYCSSVFLVEFHQPKSYQLKYVPFNLINLQISQLNIQFLAPLKFATN